MTGTEEHELVSLRHRVIAQAKKRLLLSILFGIGFSLVLFPLIGGLIVLSLTALPSALASITGKDQKDNVIRIIQGARSYKSSYTHYPTTIDDLLGTNLLPLPLIKELMDPITKNKYYYRSTREGKDCIAITVLPNKDIYSVTCQNFTTEPK